MASCAVSPAVENDVTIEGEWELESFTVNDESAAVVSGVNAASQPDVWFEEESVSGNLGCNEWSAEDGYVFDGSTLVLSEVFRNIDLCIEEGSDLMAVENVYLEVLRADEIDVRFEPNGITPDGRMIWDVPDYSLTFGRLYEY